MILDGSYFKYGTYNSDTDKLIFAHIETSENTQLVGSVTSNHTYNKRARRSYALPYTYSDSNLVFDAEIIREDGSAIGSTLANQIERSLFNSIVYKKLYRLVPSVTAGVGESVVVIDDDNNENPTSVATSNTNTYQPDSKYFNCRIINPSAIFEGCSIIGYKVTIECDSDTMWEDLTTVTPTIGVGGTFTITVNSDFTDYIYPTVEFTTGESETSVSFINGSDSSSRLITFSSVPANTTIKFCGETNYVYPAICYGYLSTQNFIRLVDGVNNMSVTATGGTVSGVKFSWSNKKSIE